MPGPNGHLAAATERRAMAARDRAHCALRRLDRQGEPVTFATVAAAAHVSRSLLYRDPTLRAEIERLRRPARPTAPRLPAAQRTTEASFQQRVENLLEDLRALRAENHQLREQLATHLGEHRATAVPGRTTSARPPMGPPSRTCPPHKPAGDTPIGGHPSR
jgi:hypothetical protein